MSFEAIFSEKAETQECFQVIRHGQRGSDRKHVVLVVISGIRGSRTTADVGGKVGSSGHFRILGIRHAIPYFHPTSINLS
jgi:hypothetical protein